MQLKYNVDINTNIIRHIIQNVNFTIYEYNDIILS